MSKKRAKVGIIFCGGSGVQNSEGRIIKVSNNLDVEIWLKEVSELTLIADLEPHFLFDGSSMDATPKAWIQIAKKINEIYRHVSGIVIIHNLDSVIYTASMISFMLQGLNKPIVFTGSALTGEANKIIKGVVNYNNLGVRANLINAIQIATMDFAEVVISFGNRILRANQAIKGMYPSMNYFQEFSSGLVGRVDFGIKLFENIKKNKKSKLDIQYNIDHRLGTMCIEPTTLPEQFTPNFFRGYDALLIRSYVSDPFPSSFFPYLRLAYERQIPVVVHNIYDKFNESSHAEYIVINTMTYEATLTKCLWVLGKVKEPEIFKKVMYQNISGEINQSFL
ncbi:MAG: asparaginase domain-containing protein [Patescibacteria group bacterium]|jgi:L-asparaginase